MKLINIVFVIICTLLFATLAFGFQTSFTPNISISEEYTDNYFLTDNNKEGEFTTTISPSFTAGMLGKTSGAEITYDLEYAAYNKYTENNTWRHNARFTGWKQLSKNARINLRDSFMRTEDPVTDENIAALRTEQPNLLIDNTIRRSRNVYYTNSVGFDFTYQFGRSDSLKFGYANDILENDDPTLEDNMRHNPTFGLTYWITPEWGVEANGSYTKAEYDTSEDNKVLNGNIKLTKKFTRNFAGFLRYDHRVTTYEGDTEDEKNYNPSAGINYSIAKDISLSVDVGYFIKDQKKRSNESGVTVNSSLVKAFRRGSLNLTGSGGYDYSLYGAEDLGFSKFYEAGGSASWQITRHISGNLFASYRDDKYKGISPEREDKTTGGGAGLTINPLKWLSIGLNYTYRSINSTLNTNDYVENKGTIRIRVTPSVPYRKKF